jgi:REP element-mobilizing transposase RayT
MVHGYHLIMTAYGFWLPNDPRGSWSDFVGAWELYWAGGRATKVETRRSVAGKSHDREARLAVKQSLKREPVSWTGVHAVAIARGFREVGAHWGLRFFACSVLPNHVHLVIERTDRDISQVMNQLKGRASGQMAEAGIHPFQEVFEGDGKRATCWARRGWSVFLDSVGDMRRAIRYVEENPVKEGKRRQRWEFVEAY